MTLRHSIFTHLVRVHPHLCVIGWECGCGGGGGGGAIVSIDSVKSQNAQYQHTEREAA